MLTAYHAFGLHITDVAVKLAELAPKRDNFQLIAYGKRKLPPTAVIDGAINNPNEVAIEIQKLLENPTFGRVTTNFVVCSLPESRVFLKAISLPKFPLQQLEEAILWEARSLLPLPPEKAYYQQQILGQDNNQVEALMAATEQKLVEGYLAVLRKVHLTPIAFDLECFATNRTIEEKDLAKRVILQLHLGTNVTTLTILRSGQVWFSHTLNTGILPLIEEMAQELGLSLKEAETMLNKTGVSGLSGEKTLKTIATGITDTVKFYGEQVEPNGREIEAIVVSGGYSQIPLLIERLAKLIPHLPVAKARPRLSFAGLPANIANLPPVLISIGLALRGAHPARWEADLNFLPQTFVNKLEAYEAKRQTYRLMTIMGYLTIVMIAILGIAAWRLYGETGGIKQLYQQKQIIATSHPARQLFPWVKEANIRVKLLNELEALRFPLASLLKRIAASVPQGVQLKTLTFKSEDKRVSLTGVALSRGHLLAFSQKLSEDGAIEAVVVPLSSFDKASQLGFTIEFLVDSAKL